MANDAPAVQLLDIEGTTTPISFVVVTLFSYARARLRQYLNDTPIQPSWWATSLKEEHHADQAAGQQPPPIADISGVADYLLWLMDCDRKSTALKYIQGQMWDRGFRQGELKGEIFPDVVPAFERWQAAGRRVAIFSSGSVQAQQALFRHTASGDLTPYITAWFDTKIGGKKSSQSYVAIAKALDTPPYCFRFLSDVAEELDAAKEAGYDVVLVVRPGATPDKSSNRYAVVRSFEELD